MTDAAIKGAARIEPDRFGAELYTDPAIFDAEIERIFHKTWVWVAHESELARPGDFKTTRLGRLPVIVTRDRAGKVNVLINRCRHRAATLCEEQTGNTSTFVCPYHAWRYALDGRLIGMPYDDGYAGVFDKADLPLAAMNVGIYNGLIFASADRDAMPLDQHLGDARPWIDLFMHQSGGFSLKAAGSHKFRFAGNWKIQLENTTDAYHFPFVHRSFVNSLDDDAASAFSTFVGKEGPYVQALGNGHSVAVFFPDIVDIKTSTDRPVPEPYREIADQLAGKYPPDRVAWIVRAIGGVGFNLNLFPNLGLSSAFLRELRPLAVDRTEIRHIALTMDGGPDAANQLRLRTHEKFQGACGFGSPDDVEAWERVQRGAGGDRDDLWVLLNRGTARERGSADGKPMSHVTDETGMREAYAQWQRMMQP
jgi:phenylpropionate dioxygenase-like ring-hydroxylating dioxygenase large terminal subunit